MTTTAPVRCDGCHRWVVVGPVLRDGDGGRYGPKCGTARGLRPGRRVRVGKPKATAVEQPPLDGLEIRGTTLTYIQEAIDAVKAELPGLDAELARLYALLALTTGITTSLEDVHDAWAVWVERTRPEHPSLVPFGRLTPEVQELDRPYMDGIRRAVRRIAVAESGDARPEGDR